MRPNLDIAWGVHGQVKEYANREDISLDEAYEELLMVGLAERPGRIHQIIAHSIEEHDRQAISDAISKELDERLLPWFREDVLEAERATVEEGRETMSGDSVGIDD